MAIFVCKASKDVHKEVVSELSTKAFLAAFKRMIARRALPSDIYCDNAINFAGAANHLHELKKFVPLTSLTFILSLLGHHISAGCGKRRWKARRDCWTYSYSFIVWSKWLLSNYSGSPVFGKIAAGFTRAPNNFCKLHQSSAFWCRDDHQTRGLALLVIGVHKRTANPH